MNKLCVIVVVIFGVCVVGCLADYTVYGESFGSKFMDWSYGTHNNTYSGNAHSGVSCISFTPTSYGAVYFAGAGQITTTNYSRLEFWVWRPTGSAPKINVNFVVYSGGSSTVVGPDSQISVYANNIWSANTWVKVVVPLNLFPQQSYDGFWFQDKSGASSCNYTVLFDDIVLVSSISIATVIEPTTKPTITTTAASSTKSTTTAAAATSSATTKFTSATTGSASAGTTASASIVTTTTSAKGTTTATVAVSISSSSGSSSTTGSVVVGGDADVMPLYNNVQSGTGTYYGNYTGGGACMLDPTPFSGLNTIANTVAIANWLGSKTCGMCISVTATGSGSGSNPILGTRIVFVNNECPSCTSNGLDFGLAGDGAWGITWKAVPCPVGSTNIQYVFKSGSSASWMGLQVRNTKYPVASFSVWMNNVWIQLPRQDYNYFVAGFSSALVFPIKIQLVNVQGQTAVDTISSVQNGVIINGNIQL